MRNSRSLATLKPSHCILKCCLFVCLCNILYYTTLGVLLSHTLDPTYYASNAVHLAYIMPKVVHLTSMRLMWYHWHMCMHREQSTQEVQIGSKTLHIDQLRKLVEQSGNTVDLGIRPDNQITVQETINISMIAELIAQDKQFSQRHRKVLAILLRAVAPCLELPSPEDYYFNKIMKSCIAKQQIFDSKSRTCALNSIFGKYTIAQRHVKPCQRAPIYVCSEG